jgi:hypothetical protein
MAGVARLRRILRRRSNPVGILVICSIFPRNIARSIKGFSAFFRLFADGVVADWKREMIGVGNVPVREEILKPIEVIRKPNRVLGQGSGEFPLGK